MLTDSARRQLEEQGFLALPAFLSNAEVERFRARVEELFTIEADRSGSEFKQEPGARRLANMVDKGELFEKVIETPQVLECIETVLGPDFKLSSLNVRSANPHGNSGQPLHVDSGELPDERGNTVCNSVWMRLPEQGVKAEGEILVTGKAGTVVVMNAHMWHGGTDNRTDRARRAMHVYYTRGDKPQQQYQKKWVRAEVQARLSPLGRKLLALDDPRNDELSAAGSGKSGFMK
jgi:hypothetical protein